MISAPDNQQGSPKRPYRRHGKDPAHPLFPHGLFAGYKAGCRCEVCVQANRDLKRDYTRELRRNNRIYADAQRADKRAYRQTDHGRAGYKIWNRTRDSGRKAEGDSKLMRLIYRMCPEGWHVDHIVPISRGGRHHPDNLQYLPAEVNQRKHTRLEYDVSAVAIRWQDLIGEPSTTRA